MSQQPETNPPPAAVQRPPPTVQLGPETAPAPAPDAAEAGWEEARSFGDYDLLGEIGRGGMGVVYRARDRQSGHMVALKMMLQERAPGPAELRRFRLEARATGQINHRGIVAIHAWGEQDGRLFYTMDYV